MDPVDELVHGLTSVKDIKQKLQLVTQLYEFVTTSIISSVEPRVVAGALAPHCSDTNFRVSEAAIRTIGEIFVQYPAVLSSGLASEFDQLVGPVIERLGDAKEQVRDEAQRTLAHVANATSNLGQVFSAVVSRCAQHKNPRAREEALVFLLNTVMEKGTASHPIQAQLPVLIKLLEDQSVTVRQACNALLEAVYKHMGEKLLLEVQRQNIRSQIVSSLTEQLSTVEILEQYPSSQKELPEQFLQEKKKKPAPQVAQQESSRPTASGVSAASVQKTLRSKPVQSRTISPPDSGDADSSALQVTDKQLSKEMEDISGALCSMENDWERRTNALKKLAGMAKLGAQSIPTFLPLLTRLREYIGSQCLDLRSQVVKEATRAIEVLSSSLGDSLDSPITDTWTDSLLKLIGCANHVMAEYGNVALRAMLSQSRIGKPGVLKITEILSNSKSPFQRQSAAEALAIILTTVGRYPPGTFERSADQIEAAVKLATTDGSPGVRSAARQAFWSLHSLWPERGEKILATVELSVKKILLDERQKCGTSSLTQQSSSSAKLSPRKTVSVTSSLKGAEGQDLSLLTAVKQPSSIRTPVKASGGLAPAGQEKLASTDVSDMTAVRRRQAQQFPASLSLSPSASSPALSDLPSGPSTLKHEGKYQAKTLRHEQPSRVDRGGSASSVGTSVSSMSSTTASLSEMPTFTVDLGLILELAIKPAWTDRVRAFEDLKRAFQSRSAQVSHQGFVDKTIAIFEKQIEDPHVKVAKAVLEALLSGVRAVAPLFTISLPIILPPIFRRLVTSKDELRILTSAILEELLRTLEAPALMPALIHVLEQPNPKVCVACLEFLMQAFEQYPQFFSGLAHARQFILKFAALLSDRSPDVRRAAVAALERLYLLNVAVFVSVFQQIPFTAQSEVRKVMPPSLEADLLQRMPPDKRPVPAVQAKMLEQVPVTVSKPKLPGSFEPLQLPQQQTVETMAQFAGPSTSAETASTLDAVRIALESLTSPSQTISIDEAGRHVALALRTASARQIAATPLSKFPPDTIFEIREAAVAALRDASFSSSSNVQAAFAQRSADISRVICETTAEGDEDNEPERQIAAAASDAAVVIAESEALDCVQAMDGICAVLLGHSSEKEIVTALLMLRKTLPRVPQEVAVEVLRRVGHLIGKQLSQDLPMPVRKGSALCLVEFFFSAGSEPLRPVLESLASQHQKLINAYVSKRLALLSNPSAGQGSDTL